MQRRMSIQRRSIDPTAFHHYFHQAEAEEQSSRGEHPAVNLFPEDAAKQRLHRLATVATAAPDPEESPSVTPRKPLISSLRLCPAAHLPLSSHGVPTAAVL